MRMVVKSIAGGLHTLKGGLSIINMIKNMIGLSKNMIQCVYGLFLNHKLNNLIAKSCIIAKESMSFRHCVHVLVEEDYAWIA